MVSITSDVNWTPGRANKVLGAGVQTSYVHSSKIYNIGLPTPNACNYLEQYLRLVVCKFGDLCVKKREIQPLAQIAKLPTFYFFTINYSC